ncbi:sm-like protein LSM8 [Nicotiana sylvestris]|uniref:sm-like protein LSM8 n=1 Tax=Nicotiana sylvestris TaxID=4096 RepID=UPI00388C9AB8
MAGSQSPLVESTTLTIPLPTSTDLFLRGTKSSSLWDDSFTKWSTRRAEVLDVEAAAGRVGLAKAKGQTEDVLRGFDQATNLILDESHERVYSTKKGVQQIVLGLYIIRGDNISVVGELDEEQDANLDMSKLRAHPLKPVVH